MEIFNHKLVSELAWAIGSTPLMVDNIPKNIYKTLDEGWCENQYHLHKDWLLELDENPKTLEEYLETDHRLLLGKRFEKLLTFWLESSPHWEVLIAGRQLKDNGRTIGEIDYVIKEKASDEVFHLEAACKFYLSSRNSPNWKEWIGPNGSDSLHEKMTKLDRQLSIFEKPVAQNLLGDLKIKKPLPILFMKGYFFHHFKSIVKAKGPKFATKKYPSGWYIYERECDDFFGGGTHWLLLPKSSWLSPFRYFLGQDKVMSASEMTEQVRTTLTDYRRSVLIVQINFQNGFATELSRGFVVKNDWG